MRICQVGKVCWQLGCDFIGGCGSEDEALHLRIPAMGLVAEMHARFEELTHGEFWQSHNCVFLQF